VKGAAAATLDACGPVFEAAFEAAHFPIAQQPLALTISDLLHGRTAGVTTIGCGDARRVSHRFIAAGTITKNFRMVFAA
jgi:hypothetical protein